MNSWSCDDYEAFKGIQEGYVIVAYTSKCIEMLVFTVLMVVLIYDKATGNGQIGKLPIFVVFLAVVNSVFAIVRVNALFPGDNDVNV